MKTAAIICEYNPFHNGHAYMLRTLREEGFDRIVCFMSGNFVQRGEPAIVDKYTRAKAALLSGADLVLEMPVIFATSSARDFASCGVRLATETGVCTHLCYGIEPESDPASAGLPEISLENEEIAQYLKEGYPYPEAVSRATGLPKRGPNAILAAEYRRALSLFADGTILPYPVQRIGDRYDSDTVSGEGYASARSIRNMILSGQGSEIAGEVPAEELADILSSSPVTADHLSLLLSDRLLREEDFTKYLDVSREISERLRNRRNILMSFTDRIADTKTRQYTYTRIQRALLHIILGITEEAAANLKRDGWFRYFRVLAYRKESGLLREIKRSASVPVISRTADLLEIAPSDFYYDQLYLGIHNGLSEYLRSPFIL